MTPTTIEFRSHMTVNLEDTMGDDRSILSAMLVSTNADLFSLNPERDRGRINFLMKNRHGSPFEHGSMTFSVAAPIFVFREFHRHRIGWSYNEMSGRYTELEPVFYTPNRERNLVQTGKPGAYEMVPGTSEQYHEFVNGVRSDNVRDWQRYQSALGHGISKELARITLPVNIYSKMFATCNPRSLMAFLSLRTAHPDATYPSTPMREIEMVAEQMEAHFARLFPLTYEAFNNNGRVAP